VKSAVLVPAHNEADSLVATLERVRRSLPAAVVVVVNSGSTDDTAAIARAWGARVIEQGGTGYARALSTGYRACARMGFQQVLQLDADGQHPPEEGPRLLEALQGADWVIGSRTPDSPSPLVRRAARRILAVAVQSLTQQPLQDVTSGYWALNQRALQVFAQHFPLDVADANIRVLGNRMGLRMKEIPVEMTSRSQGESMHDGWAGAWNFTQSLGALHRAARIPGQGVRQGLAV
jgi:glycosyltransferase involved in cell wall biosynthesis